MMKPSWPRPHKIIHYIFLILPIFPRLLQEAPELTAEDEAKAKKLYKSSLKGTSEEGLNTFKFKGAMLEM